MDGAVLTSVLCTLEGLESLGSKCGVPPGFEVEFLPLFRKVVFYYINNPIVRESAPCAQEKHLNDLLRTLVTLFLLITWTNLQPHLPQNWERTIASILRTCSHNPAFATIQ